MTDGEFEPIVAAAPRRTIGGRFWHQGPTGRSLDFFVDPATSEGRYHRFGGSGVWYASDSEQAAWAEFFRNFVDEGIDPFEVRRRTGYVDVENLTVLDLTDAEIRATLGIVDDDLIDDDYQLSQAIGQSAVEVGFDGILAPSAALPGARTLAIFRSGMDCITAGPSTVNSPPRSMIRLIQHVRFRGDLPSSVLRLLHAAGTRARRTIQPRD